MRGWVGVGVMGESTDMDSWAGWSRFLGEWERDACMHA